MGLDGVRLEGDLRRLDLGDIFQFLWQLCPPSNGNSSVLWDQEQLKELWFGDDRVSRGFPTHCSAHPIPVAHRRLPWPVHHHRLVLRRRRGPHTPLPRMSVTEKNSRKVATCS